MLLMLAALGTRDARERRQFTMETQHPVRQKVPVGQGVVALQTTPPVQVWPGPPVVVHSGGSVVFPMQSSHVSHVFAQLACCVHGGHFTGSLMSAMEQVPARRTDFDVPFASLTAQHPKQSQPFGVSFWQLFTHAALCVGGQFLKLGS